MTRRPAAWFIAGSLVTVVLAGCTSSPSPSPSPGSATQSTSGSAVPLPPPATTPVPPPTPGDTSSTVKGRTVVKRKSVGLGSRAETADKVGVTLAVKAITAKAQGPGEVAGPALAVTVKIANDTGTPVDLSTAVVTLTASDGKPGSIMAAPPAAPFPDSVPVGDSVRGTFVFTVPKSRRNPVTIEVSTSPDVPLVVFRGRANS